ncbi:hypothetical protein N657DRAFT_645949 [Parathielavia appendiculata]|uniref:Uncharacterized protein n=1 Tax=Parathielavia appendiculata TaxID=2587402 RepID=A0AAN6TZV5_9PEZI|nr:hypothetical protein N657DRAFT_645949 [Parathielavia appendiculata]
MALMLHCWRDLAKAGRAVRLANRPASSIQVQPLLFCPAKTVLIHDFRNSAVVPPSSTTLVGFRTQTAHPSSSSRQQPWMVRERPEIVCTAEPHPRLVFLSHFPAIDPPPVRRAQVTCHNVRTEGGATGERFLGDPRMQFCIKTAEEAQFESCPGKRLDSRRTLRCFEKLSAQVVSRLRELGWGSLHRNRLITLGARFKSRSQPDPHSRTTRHDGPEAFAISTTIKSQL